MTEVILIAAVAEDGTIGDNGKIPWSYSSDLQFFAERTTDHTVVMGRKTYDNVGKLPNRTNIVVSKTLSDDSVIVCRNAEDVSDTIRWIDEDKVFIIGGESIYRAFTDADKLIITQIPGEYDGDTKFPKLSPTEWGLDKEYSIDDTLTVVEYSRVDHKNRFYL